MKSIYISFDDKEFKDISNKKEKLNLSWKLVVIKGIQRLTYTKVRK